MALVFDFDGVIVDTKLDNIAAINVLAPRYGFDPIQLDQYISMASCNFYEYWQMLLGQHAEAFFSDLRMMPRAQPRIVDGMLDVLVVHRPAIVSSNFTELIKGVLASTNLSLDVYGGDFEPSKVRKLGMLSKEPDVFVTDTVGDVQEGKAAGYRVIAVTWGVNTREMLEKSAPHSIVATPQELLAVLQAH